jgi:hypothetical protein
MAELEIPSVKNHGFNHSPSLPFQAFSTRADASVTRFMSFVRDAFKAAVAPGDFEVKFMMITIIKSPLITINHH